MGGRGKADRHAPGGVCPFVNPDGVKKYCDVSLKDYDYVYPACGSSNSAIRLTRRSLRTIRLVRWVDVTKPRE
ncbi:MAG: YbaK/EbsC family protein [Christensenellales bacterium]